MFPNQDNMIVPLLKIAAEYPEGLAPATAYEDMARLYPRFTEKERRIELPSGNGNKWENNVRWAKKKAATKGWIRSRNKIWFLTAAGWTHLRREWKRWEPR